MKRVWRSYGGDDSGASAVEFALVLPIVAALLLFGLDSWLRLSHAHDTTTALQTGVRYYQDGGADDEAARTLALSSWPNRPSDATLSINRSCTCSVQIVACTQTCDGVDPPQTHVTLIAQGTFRGMRGSDLLSQQETLRVR
ncbi:pilus assembly protein [Phenylobacterium sp. LjRoot225]|uniref:TadE/TadG family type IV pilus assembly protein n=1 Tax=Phenylobacterium sp. LjRoot225 TaxID=3342285 RepID=UPI003ECECD01